MKRTEEEVVLAGLEVPQVEETTEGDAFLYAVTSQTPWWIVSVLLHGLVITLAALMSIGIKIEDDDPLMVEQCDFIKQKELNLPPQERPKEEPADRLKSPVDVPATDANAQEHDDVLVPPDLLAIAELGSHFETNNPDRKDTQSALGVEGSHIFYSARGVVDDVGGGGLGGNCLEDPIGLGGGVSPGTGGGFGGGNGPGIGPDNGRGFGSIGNRFGGGRTLMVKRFTHSTKALDTVDFGLGWLAYHQEPDGHWDAKKYGADVKTDTACTGFALLAFLGSGHSERNGTFKGNVQRAVAWLKSKQDADGMIWDTSDDQAHHRAKGYPCAIATLALVEAAAMATVRDTVAAAQKAVDYCTEKHQSGEGYERGGWRYAPKELGDLSVTGWFVMALKSAKVARLNVNPQAFDAAIKFLDSVEKKDAGGGAYGPVSHYWYTPDNEHAQTGHRLAAIGNLVRQFLGWKKEELQSSVEWLVNKGGVPSWGANGEAVDLYYWYYGSMCLFQQGGEVWERWNKGLLSALLDNQCKQGDDRGSWNPVGEFSHEWGRVGQTALSSLCLEVYWRYKQMQSDK
ncbi:MAG: prenyltransferase/squalene oxidase repeat-containing protein [Planctomycetota bacterium]